MKECSFKPNLNENKSRKASKIRSSMLGLGDKISSATSNISESGAQTERSKKLRGKSISLIQSQYVDKYLAKPKIKQQKSKLDIEYEKQKENCTFKPEIYSQNATSQIKKTQQTVGKMRRSKAARKSTS